MLIFTQMSFTMLSIGSLVISAIARTVGGNRTWAVVMALITIFVSLAMFFTYDASGILPAAVGAIALIMAILPKSKKRQ